MRLLLVTYQKSGTHQIMPVFMPLPDIVDRSHQQMNAVYKLYSPDLVVHPSPHIQETITALKTFPSKAYGHITYCKEYDEILRGNTDVLFNVRDPRDIIMAEVHNAKRKYDQGERDHAWMNIDIGDGNRLFDQPNPIPYLIDIARERWVYWLGWINEFPNTHVIRYEDIRMRPVDTYNTLRNLFISHGVGLEHFAKNIKPKKKNPTFVSGRTGDWKWAFSEDEKKYAKERLGFVIRRLGYEL